MSGNPNRRWWWNVARGVWDSIEALSLRQLQAEYECARSDAGAIGGRRSSDGQLRLASIEREYARRIASK
jgi:hypothetical protein